MPGMNLLNQKMAGERVLGSRVLTFCSPVTRETKSPTMMTVKHPVAEYHM